MGIPQLHETIEESELFCEVCGRMLGFIKWFTDSFTPCQACSKAVPKELENTHKMLCVKCRNIST